MEGREITDEDYRFGYQGQYAEKDQITGWNQFQLRMYDARFGRWLSVDPYNQYSSPYVSLGNNPTASVDPNGGIGGPVIRNPLAALSRVDLLFLAGTTFMKEVVVTAARMASSASSIVGSLGRGVMSVSVDPGTPTPIYNTQDERVGYSVKVRITAATERAYYDENGAGSYIESDDATWIEEFQVGRPNRLQNQVQTADAGISHPTKSTRDFYGSGYMESHGIKTTLTLPGGKPATIRRSILSPNSPSVHYTTSGTSPTTTLNATDLDKIVDRVGDVHSKWMRKSKFAKAAELARKIALSWKSFQKSFK